MLSKRVLEDFRKGLLYYYENISLYNLAYNSRKRFQKLFKKFFKLSYIIYYYSRFYRAYD